MQTLGLDIGTNSIGWALVSTSDNAEPSGIIDLGVRIFEAGVAEGGSKSGPKNKERREKRILRRQYDRRRRRKQRLAGILRQVGLLPAEGDLATIIQEIDRQCLNRYSCLSDDPVRFAHTIPYYLRAGALDQRLDHHELGRAIYHLAQRRGFLSNRKAKAKDVEEEGKVKAGISALEKEIQESGARTLGEHFAGLDPEQERIRKRYTHRQMYLDEFEAIWETQRSLGNDILDDKLKIMVHNAIFFQRRLKSVKQLIGECVHEPGEKRCPWYRLEAQRFRILQNINNLRLIDSDGVERPLEKDEKKKLIPPLELNASITLAAAREILGFKRGTAKFTIEAGGEKHLRGDRTGSVLKSVFGERWEVFSDSERRQIVEELSGFEKEWALAKRLRIRWGLDENESIKLSGLSLEDGYCNLSLKAISKLLPLMEQGLSYPEAAVEIYGEFKHSVESLDTLPPVDDIMKGLRNPIVHRCLTELRRCVNAVISRYGKPDLIRVELAREVKLTRKEKDRIIQRNRENQAARDRAASEILGNTDIKRPSRDDILKYQLAEECNWLCPYTGKPIGWDSLFGAHPEFDIEHIIPFSVSLDDSFFNKTLCWSEENRGIKRNHTPFEAYSQDPEKYGRILTAVKKFRGNAAREKLRRFMLDDISEFEDFSSRHLNDTRHASKEAAAYLALLYGGLSDVEGRLRIHTVKGQITAHLRNLFGFNTALGGERKNRDDHRHHCIDALVVALTSPEAIRRLSGLAARYEGYFQRVHYREPLPPWEGAREQLSESLQRTIPVHRYNQKLRGALHEETLYARGPEKDSVHYRKPLESLNAGEVDKIADRAVRELVRARLRELGTNNPDVFKNAANRPMLRGRDGRARTINAVTLEKKLKTFRIGEGDRQRNVKGGNNHHIEIFAELDENGNELRWDGVVVSLFEALQRRKRGLPIITRDFGPRKKFKFSLACGDMVEMEAVKGVREVFVMRSVDHTKEMAFVRATDARLKKDIRATGNWVRKLPTPLMLMFCRKVFLTPFGEVRYAND